MARKRTLSTDEVAQFIADVPHLIAIWRPPNRVRRKRVDEVAKGVAKAFEEAGIEVRR